VTLDPGFVEALVKDYDHAPLSAADRGMLDYVTKVTRDATTVGPADHERLRSLGFEDRGILQMTLLAAWFNYINRVADALGVNRG
jgi:alkylhydroperoxidase family enzyme